MAPVGVFEAPRVQLATGLSGAKERRPLSGGSTIIAPPQAFPPVSSSAGRPQAGDKLAMVTLDADIRVNFYSNLPGTPPYKAPVGTAVEVTFEEVAPGQLIHEWRVVA